ISLPELGQARLAINYVASSSADANAMSAAANAGIAIPSSVNVIPALRINEQTIATANAVPFGTSQVLKYRFIAPTITTPEVVNEIIAGEQLALGVDLGNISPAQLRDEADYFQQTQNR